MLLKYIKELSVKNILKSKLVNVKPSTLNHKIQTIGILIDESYFFDKELLVKELVGFEIENKNISLLIYKDKIKKTEVFNYPNFSYQNMNWKGEISDENVKKFENSTFDLLISYYDIEKTPLLLVTHHSKALFKVGFSSTDKRLHHLMINTTAENYQVFVHELFRYLKILNKI